MSKPDPVDDPSEDRSCLRSRLARLEASLDEKDAVIAAQNSKLSAYYESSIDALVQIDTDGIITGWNGRAERIFGWRSDEILGCRLEETIIPPRYRQAHVDGMRKFIETGEGKVIGTLIEIHALHRDGHEFPVELSISLIESSHSREFSAYIRDISERKHAETVIWNQANFDALTSLPNRNLFLHRLEQEIRGAERQNESIALLYVDLDRFKDVNDSLGHDMGDLLLIEISSRLKAAVRDNDTVARLSGDEFAIILSRLDDPLVVERICVELLESLARPYPLDNEIVYLTASIGITIYPDDSQHPEMLQKNADQAMYAAKASGRNRYHYFTIELEQQAQRRRQLIRDLRTAIERRQFEVYYQPIVEIGSDRLTKAEALLRWHHPDDGIVSPATFIPVAEECGLIAKIGDWVFYRATEQVRQWRERYGIDFQVSINTSPQQWLDNVAAMNDWFGHLDKTGLAGQAVTVEITEGLLMDVSETVTNRLLDFRDARVQVSIDDFGTGYSSLSYLKQFDIDYLKIDQSFVRNLEQDPNDLALCEAIIVMAHKLGIQVIAEGVETAAQLEALRTFGCDYAQGYFYSKPLPANDLERLLANPTLLGSTAADTPAV